MWNKILIGFLAIMILVPVGGAFASAPSYDGLATESYPHYVTYKYTEGENTHYRAILFNYTHNLRFSWSYSNDYMVVDATGSTHRYIHATWNPVTQLWEKGSSVLISGNAFSRVMKDGDNLVDSTFDLMNSGTVFFQKPAPPKPIAEGVGLENLASHLVKTMVDGGVLSVALIVFAILLGVGLVPRLVYSFLR